MSHMTTIHMEIFLCP